MISGANISATSYTQSNDFLDPILSNPQYKFPSITFAYDADFTKGATDDGFFFEITELNICEFDNYDCFSASTVVGPFGPNCVYATTHHIISISLSITTIVPAAFTIASLVQYCINGLSGLNRPVYVNKLGRSSSSIYIML